MRPAQNDCVKTLLALSILILTARCATIANGRFQQVPVTSDPAGANIRVACGGPAVDAGTTPANLKLRRSAASCSITLSKAGFRDHSITFQRSTSGWFWANAAGLGLLGEVGVELATGPPIYVFDDASSDDRQVNGVGFVAGTLLGMWIDHMTGAQYRFRPERVDVKLE